MARDRYYGAKVMRRHAARRARAYRRRTAEAYDAQRVASYGRQSRPPLPTEGRALIFSVVILRASLLRWTPRRRRLEEIPVAIVDHFSEKRFSNSRWASSESPARHHFVDRCSSTYDRRSP